MKAKRYILSLVSVFALFVIVDLGLALAQAGKTCCDKALARGKACTHPCCVGATKKHTICFKCNPLKATCCDKASQKGGECLHPCCVKAQKASFICTNCNPGRAVALFDGKSLEGWKPKERQGGKNLWKVGKAGLNPDNPKDGTLTVGKGGKEGSALVNRLADGHGRDIQSVAEFGDALIEVEVMVAKGSNSGIYVMGEYEIQILDSHGKPAAKLGMGDMGAVYNAARPPINACKKAGEWQKFVIDFRAPRFDKSGKKIQKARFVKISLNGKVLHKDLVLKEQTPGGVKGKEVPVGPLMFQGDHGEVAYRNIYVTPIIAKK